MTCRTSAANWVKRAGVQVAVLDQAEEHRLEVGIGARTSRTLAGAGRSASLDVRRSGALCLHLLVARPSCVGQLRQRVLARDESSTIGDAWRESGYAVREPAAAAEPRATSERCADPAAAARRSTALQRAAGPRAAARRRCSATSTAPSRRSSPTPPRPWCPRRSAGCSRRSRRAWACVAFVTGRDSRGGGAWSARRRRLRRPARLRDDAADGAVARDPQAERYVAAVQRGRRRRVRATSTPRRLGLVVENKGTMLALHYRLAADPAATRPRSSARDRGPRASSGWPSPPATSWSSCARPMPFDQGHGRAPPAGRPATTLDGASVSWATTSPTAPVSRPCTTGRRARRAAARRCAVAALTAETPRPVTDEADVWCAATPGVARGAHALLDGDRRLSAARRRVKRGPAGAAGAAAAATTSAAAELRRLRFSRNAAMPSRRSSLAKASANRSRSIPWPASMSTFSGGVDLRLEVAHGQRALGGELPGQLDGLGHELVPGNTACTSPMRSASAARIMRPLRHR